MILVLIINRSWVSILITRICSGDDKQMRTDIEKIAEINARIILICKGAESEALHKIRVIAEILGY
jgi:hypothetical protein